jgi:hypothetical protein
VQKSPISYGTLEATILASKRLYEVFAVAFSGWSNGEIGGFGVSMSGMDMDRSLVTEFREGSTDAWWLLFPDFQRVGWMS